MFSDRTIGQYKTTTSSLKFSDAPFFASDTKSKHWGDVMLDVGLGILSFKAIRRVLATIWLPMKISLTYRCTSAIAKGRVHFSDRIAVTG